ncbi:unnamed protein product, partial [Mesorhabditis spiculigera]
MLPFTSTISYGTNDDDYIRKPVNAVNNAVRYEKSPIQQQFYQPLHPPVAGVAHIQTQRIEQPVVRTVIKQDAPIPLVRAPVAAPRPMVCKKCQKTVYEAEKVLAAGAVWHKSGCFNCSDCNKRLESRTQCEQGGKLYCNACYGRQFGPRGYGHGVGAGLLQLYQ